MGQVGEDDDGFGVWFWVVLNNGMVAGRMGAEDEPGAGTDFDTNGEFADASISCHTQIRQASRENSL